MLQFKKERRVSLTRRSEGIVHLLRGYSRSIFYVDRLFCGRLH